MANLTQKNIAGFGTAPVFFTAISTILGAILFLRFGYAVGHQGFIGVIGIILLGHLVTIPTAMAVAEIATNQKVQADLTIISFNSEKIKTSGYDKPGNILFVSSNKEKEIK